MMAKSINKEFFDQLDERLDADVLDEEYPIEWVEQELRDAGIALNKFDTRNIWLGPKQSEKKTSE